MEQKKKVIIDGDWGGDEMQLATVLLGNPGKVEVLGATATFGNTHHDQVLENGRNILHFLKAPPSIHCYPGARCPTGATEQPVGDGAHGADGIGNVGLAKSPAPYETKSAVDYILETLRTNDPGTISITASGPLTNIAQALKKDPATMKRVKEIVIMGGCTEDMKAHDRDIRRGNITYHAEFNFQQAAQDASDVMSSGLPITLLPMNCTHQLMITPKRQEMIKKEFASDPRARDALLGMMTAPAPLERRKFNCDPVMHDINCALYLLHPDEYVTRKGHVAVSTVNDTSVPFAENPQGGTVFRPDENSNMRVAGSIKNPDRMFGIFMDGIKTCLSPRQARKERSYKAPNIMVVGSSNMDLSVFADRFPQPGETIVSKKSALGHGGKGANQAVAARSSGANVAMVSCVGDDLFGADVLANYKKRGIDTTGVKVLEGTPTGTAAIFVDTAKEGQNRIIVNLGANEKLTPDVFDSAIKQSQKPDCIVMQCEMPLDSVCHATRYARENGITSILNAAPAQPMDLKRLAGLNYLVVNEHEAQALSGVEVVDKASAIAAAKKLLAESEIGKVIVTLGDKGAQLVSRRNTMDQEAFAAKAIDTSGAGDAWLGCFAASIAQGRSEKESIERASVFAGMSTEKIGTQQSYPSLDEFNAAMQTHAGRQAAQRA